MPFYHVCRAGNDELVKEFVCHKKFKPFKISDDDMCSGFKTLLNEEKTELIGLIITSTYIKYVLRNLGSYSMKQLYECASKLQLKFDAAEAFHLALEHHNWSVLAILLENPETFLIPGRDLVWALRKMIKRGSSSDFTGIDIILDYSEERFINLDVEMEVDGKCVSLRQIVFKPSRPKASKCKKLKRLFLSMKPFERYYSNNKGDVPDEKATDGEDKEIPQKIIKVENDPIVKVDNDFKMTFEDAKPIVKLEPLEEHQQVDLINSSGSGIQDTEGTLQQGQKRKRLQIEELK